MTKVKITLIKSPLVPMDFLDEGRVNYDNQVTYSVRLSNGIIVTRPEEFPKEEEKANLPEIAEKEEE